ncbi:MAG: hypothetical protein K2G08_01335 [Paramuribaculum sp.]|nr:hypothetical protein [Paramuribaculum sp.]
MTEVTLLNGTTLECYPIANTNQSTPADDSLSLDTTGQYLQIGSKPSAAQGPEEKKAERLRKEQLFYEHAHLFLANADMILKDSMLFFTPVDVYSGLAYTGTGGFRNPTLGVYIEWWLNHKEAAFDTRGCPIWFISGSPLSGCHACCSVDRKGRKQRARLQGTFSAVWRSFIEVNKRYNAVKGQVDAYTIEEAIELLERKTDRHRLFVSHVRLEAMKYDNEIKALKHALVQAKEMMTRFSNRVSESVFKNNKEVVEKYYEKCLDLETASRLAREFFLETRRNLRRELRSGELDNITYQRRLFPLRKRADEAEREEYIFKSNGLKDAIGEDAELLRFYDVKRIMSNSNRSTNG